MSASVSSANSAAVAAAGHCSSSSSKGQIIREGPPPVPVAPPPAPAVSAGVMNPAPAVAAPSTSNNAIMGDFLELQWTEHQNIFSQSIAKLRSKHMFTDATLACDGQFYPVHKFVLATCSEFFSAMFEWTPCVNPVLVLNNIATEDLEAILDFMYVGEASVKECQLEPVMKAAKCLRVRGLTLLEECRPVMHKPTDHPQQIGATHVGAAAISTAAAQQQQLMRQRQAPRIGAGMTTTVDSKQGIVMHSASPPSKKMKPEPMDDDVVNLPNLPRPRPKPANKGPISLPSIASLTSAIGDTSLPKTHPAHQIASAARHLSPAAGNHGVYQSPHPATVAGLPGNRVPGHPHPSPHHNQPSASPRYHHQYHHPSSSSSASIVGGGAINPSSSSSYSSQHASSPGHHPSMGGSPHNLPHGAAGQVAGSSSPHHSPQNLQLSPHSPVGRPPSLPTSTGSAGGVPPQTSNRHLQQLLSTPRGNVAQQRYPGGVPPQQQQQMLHPQQYEEMQRKQALLHQQQQQLVQQQILRRQQLQQQQQRQSQIPSGSVHPSPTAPLSHHHSQQQQQYQLQHPQQYQEQQLALHHQQQHQKEMNLSSASMQTHLKNNPGVDDKIAAHQKQSLLPTDCTSGGNSSSSTPTGNNNNLATGNNNIISDTLPIGFGTVRDNLGTTHRPDTSSLPPPPLPPSTSTSSVPVTAAAAAASSSNSASRGSSAAAPPGSSGVVGLAGGPLTPMEQQIINELGAAPDDAVVAGAAEGAVNDEDNEKGDAEQHDAEMLDVLVNDGSLYFHDDAEAREMATVTAEENQSDKPLTTDATAEGQDSRLDEASTTEGGVGTGVPQDNPISLDTSSQDEDETGEEPPVENPSSEGKESSNNAEQKQERRSVRPRSMNRPPNNTNPKKRKRKSSVSTPADAADLGSASAGFATSSEPPSVSSDAAVKVDAAELSQDGGMELIGGSMDVGAVELPMSEDEEELLLALPGGSGISGAGYMLDDVAAVSDNELVLEEEAPNPDTNYNSHLDDGASNSSTSGHASSNYSNAPAKVATRFKCPYCPKLCLKSETLSKHLETHKNKKFSCTVTGCNFETGDAGDLREHRRTHMSKMCTRCNFSTNRADSLKKHLVNHVGRHRTGDPATFCTMCDFVNKNPATLKHHMKNHHDHKYTRDSS